MAEPPNLPPTEPPSLPPPPPLPSMADPEVPVVEQQQYPVQHPEDEAAVVDVDVDVPPPVPPLIGHAAPAHINAHPNLEMPMIVAGFCFQSAVTMAAQSLQNDDDDMLCLAMVVAVAAICVSKYISTKFPVVARVLDHVGVLSGVTAFLIAVTVSSPLCLKIISWIIFAISILVILVFNCHY